MGIKEYQKTKAKYTKSRNTQILDELTKDEEAKSPQSDETFFKMKAGMKPVTLRFLPQSKPDSIPRIKVKNHWLRSPDGKRYFNFRCPKTINSENVCPVCDAAHDMWDSNEKRARTLYRKDGYLANVLIVDNPNNKEDNGKVKVYPFGKSIAKIMDAKLTPKVKNGKISKKGIDIFCPIEGLDFTVELDVKAGENTYTESYFDDAPSQIADNDTDFNRILADCFDLDDMFLNPEKFLTSEVIEKKFNELNSKSMKAKSSETVIEDNVPDTDDEQYDLSDDEVVVPDVESNDGDLFGDSD